MDKIENPPGDQCVSVRELKIPRGTNPFPFGNCKSPRGLTHFRLEIANPPGD